MVLDSKEDGVGLAGGMSSERNGVAAAVAKKSIELRLQCLWQSVQVAAEHCCSGKTAGGSCVIITWNLRKIARMNMEFRMDGLCKNGYAA
ncbi:hypothetical protein C5167_011957 [Papaver somniferum]|uniref:Uncharacterized protein n=1 Tax=Papaver somniferum TaxID=3469 RepID=A0A4Y7IZB1_PAPSO|nr:hypothetical protein C5167_011957 [Papaver somniferum]